MSDDKQINAAAEKRAQAHVEELTAALGVEREGYVRRGLTNRVEAVEAQLRALDGTLAQEQGTDGEGALRTASEPAPDAEQEPAPDAEPAREAEPRKTARKAR